MTKEQSIPADNLITESNSLIEYVNTFTNELPKCDISCLSQRLKISVNYMSENLKNSFNSTSKMDKIRSRIKLSIAIKECIDTLDLMTNLKYNKIDELAIQVNNFNQMLINSHQLEDVN